MKLFKTRAKLLELEQKIDALKKIAVKCAMKDYKYDIIIERTRTMFGYNFKIGLTKNCYVSNDGEFKVGGGFKTVNGYVIKFYRCNNEYYAIDHKFLSIKHLSINDNKINILDITDSLGVVKDSFIKHIVNNGEIIELLKL